MMPSQGSRLLLVFLCLGYPAHAQSPVNETASTSITLVSPQSGSKQLTWSELQKRIDALESDVDTVHAFLKKEAFDIFDSSYKGLNSTIDAGPGALFLKSSEFEKIQKTV